MHTPGSQVERPAYVIKMILRVCVRANIVCIPLHWWVAAIAFLCRGGRSVLDFKISRPIQINLDLIHTKLTRSSENYS